MGDIRVTGPIEYCNDTSDKSPCKMFMALVKHWQSKMRTFHQPIWEMRITLEDLLESNLGNSNIFQREVSTTITKNIIGQDYYYKDFHQILMDARGW